jgi:hypothetical protein
MRARAAGAAGCGRPTAGRGRPMGGGCPRVAGGGLRQRDAALPSPAPLPSFDPRRASPLLKIGREEE